MVFFFFFSFLFFSFLFFSFLFFSFLFFSFLFFSFLWFFYVGLINLAYLQFISSIDFASFTFQYIFLILLTWSNTVKDIKGMHVDTMIWYTICSSDMLHPWIMNIKLSVALAKWRPFQICCSLDYTGRNDHQIMRPMTNFINSTVFYLSTRKTLLQLHDTHHGGVLLIMRSPSRDRTTNYLLLRGYCIPYWKSTCFVCYLKITHFSKKKNNACIL